MTPCYETREIGNTGLSVPVLGFGAASIGNLFQAVSDEEARNTLAAAIVRGMTLIDTAPRYGAGLSERRVGDALRPLNKSEYVLSTKVGRIFTPDPLARTDELRHGFLTPMPFNVHYDYTYAGIMRSYEDSMQRLGLAEIDILLIHDIGVDTHGDKDVFYFEQLTSSGYRALDELRANGNIKAVGLGVNETKVCERVMDIGHFDCFLIAGRYSLLEQDALDSFLPKCHDYGASVILGAPYNSGILATGVKGTTVPMYNYEPAQQSIIDKVGQIENLCEQYDIPIAAAALQFPLGHEAVATVIPGIDSAQRVAQTVDLFHVKIPAEFWTDLRDKGLINPLAPVPV